MWIGAACFRLACAAKQESVAATEFIPLGDSALIWRLPDSLGEVRAAAEKLASAEDCTGAEEIDARICQRRDFFTRPIDPETSAGEILAAMKRRRRPRAGRSNHERSRSQSAMNRFLRPISRRLLITAGFRLTN